MSKNKSFGVLLALSALLWMPFHCQSNKSKTFSTDYFSIEIDNKGYIRSMKNITVRPYREFSPADKPSPLLTLYDSDKRIHHYPEKAKYSSSSKQITLSFSNGSIAKIQILPCDKYVKFTLSSLEPRNGIDAVQ